MENFNMRPENDIPFEKVTPNIRTEKDKGDIRKFENITSQLKKNQLAEINEETPTAQEFVDGLPEYAINELGEVYEATNKEDLISRLEGKIMPLYYSSEQDSDTRVNMLAIDSDGIEVEYSQMGFYDEHHFDDINFIGYGVLYKVENDNSEPR